MSTFHYAAITVTDNSHTTHAVKSDYRAAVVSARKHPRSWVVRVESLNAVEPTQAEIGSAVSHYKARLEAAKLERRLGRYRHHVCT